MKALVGAFNQEKALVGAFSVIVQPVVEPMEHYTALVVLPVPAAGGGRGSGHHPGGHCHWGHGEGGRGGGRPQLPPGGQDGGPPVPAAPRAGVVDWPGPGHEAVQQSCNR